MPSYVSVTAFKFQDQDSDGKDLANSTIVHAGRRVELTEQQAEPLLKSGAIKKLDTEQSPEAAAGGEGGENGTDGATAVKTDDGDQGPGLAGQQGQTKAAESKVPTQTSTARAKK